MSRKKINLQKQDGNIRLWSVILHRGHSGLCQVRLRMTKGQTVFPRSNRLKRALRHARQQLSFKVEYIKESQKKLKT